MVKKIENIHSGKYIIRKNNIRNMSILLFIKTEIYLISIKQLKIYLSNKSFIQNINIKLEVLYE